MPDESIFPRALDAIGRQEFAPTLLAHLNAAVGAEHCVLYRFDEDDLEILGYASSNGTAMAGVNSSRYRKDFWKRDAIFHGLKASLSGYRSEVACVPADQVGDAEFRHELFLLQHLAGRAMLVGERNDKLYGVSLFRNDAVGFFSESERHVIQSVADTLISCVAKHHDLLARTKSLSALFNSVDDLASRFAQVPAQLSVRECEVCARIVYGMSMKEIARDLAISAESGTTYQKRAFLRLGVASRAQLLRRLLEHLS
ncbi:MAG TPA: LuxR C-terminal-related transcriptional regulator [Variovorax sp.]|nr:LuxR C-terminal-related transcriptional regulator [Variovorax sp.]